MSEDFDDKSTDVDDADEQERKHFEKVVNAYKFYRIHSLKRIMMAEKYFSEIPEHHRRLIPYFRENMRVLQTCIEHNYQIILLMIADADFLFENKQHISDNSMDPPSFGEFEMDKVRSTLKQIARDWSEDGVDERRASYQPVIDEILCRFPPNECDASEVSVLVPGAGLGRLAFEIAKLGYACQGNEVSLFMLLASNFILNKCQEANSLRVYPWVHQFCNNISTSDQVRPVLFPDVSPADMPPNGNFSMAAGDFLEIYVTPDSWDCVATVFFIDTAHNVIAYIETIWKILKPGGYWINFGPLLYHFADMPNEPSVELSYEIVRDVILKMNFEILKEEIRVPATYTQNTKAMLRYSYDCISFVARKPVTTAAN